MANTPTSYAPSTLNQMSPTELENHHMLLEGRIAELNDELARVLESSETRFFLLNMQYAGIEHVVRKGVNWPCKIREWRHFTAKYLRNQAPFYNSYSTELMKITIFRIRERN